MSGAEAFVVARAYIARYHPGREREAVEVFSELAARSGLEAAERCALLLRGWIQLNGGAPEGGWRVYA